MLSRGENAKETAEIGSTDPIRTRFVIEILSGSSAGGINAVYLAKALANDQMIDKLKNLWIEEGDIGVLINDKDSVKDTFLASQDPPRSLLNGTRMYWKLLEVLDDIDEDAGKVDSSSAQNVEELDLYITATDMAGQNVKLQLADKVVEEQRHRNVFHFRCGDCCLYTSTRRLYVHHRCGRVVGERQGDLEASEEVACTIGKRATWVRHRPYPR